jgi:hypothetical protein
MMDWVCIGEGWSHPQGRCSEVVKGMVRVGVYILSEDLATRISVLGFLP